MVVAQKLKEAEITEQDSLLLTRNLLRIAIFNISYIRGLFPEKYFNDKSVPALGVYDALQKKYLRTLLFCICETDGGPMIEEYSSLSLFRSSTKSFCSAVSFSYSDSDSQEVAMNINRTGNKKQGGTFKCNSTNEVTPTQMRSSACKMVRTLVQLMRTLDRMPEERTILMKLLYYDDVTPPDYEPPFFRCCAAEEAHNLWTKKPLKMEVGNVNSKHFILALKVKSVLDPCEDDSDGNQDDDVSLGDDSVQREDSSESDSGVGSSREDQYIVAPADNQQHCEEDNMVEQDDTQDPAEDEKQLNRLKDWISSCHHDTVDITDVLSNFPDISVVLIEEIMEKLVQECVLSKIGRDVYAIEKQKKFPYEFDVKEEKADQITPIVDKAPQGTGEDYMYMKALYHALPMDYVSVAKLQSKRVIHSDMTEKKLSEVRRDLDMDAMDTDIIESQNKMNHVEFQGIDNNNIDPSTCGALRSFGSELTRTRGGSDTHQNGSIRTGQPNLEKELFNTPTSKALPVASRESAVPVKDKVSINGKHTDSDNIDNVICSWSTQEKRSRKASMVKEPILQYMKRQKSQAI
ncbi:HORMA domain-containing protein [Ancistrocladus abbreviatus]